jgi:ferredoxin
MAASPALAGHVEWKFYLEVMPPGVIEQNTIESLKMELKVENIRLSCRAKVNGDVTIRPIK